MLAIGQFKALANSIRGLMAAASHGCPCAQEWGAAVHCCDEALNIPQPADAAVKAWLRRSKANLGRHEYEVSLDLGASRPPTVQRPVMPLRAACTALLLLSGSAICNSRCA